MPDSLLNIVYLLQVMFHRSTRTRKNLVAFSLGVFLVLLTSINLKFSHANSDEAVTQTSYLNIVQERGKLICGISGELPGFSFVNSDGMYAGIDVDICRAVAAALFDDPTEVEFLSFDTRTRFEALRSQKVDLLSRNTTTTLSRDTKLGLEFMPTTFYDAQGFLVKKNSNIDTLSDLAGKTICIADNTPSLDTLNDRMKQLGLKYNPLLFEDNEALFNAYEYERCAAVTRDVSQLAIRRTLLANPKEHEILSQTISKEPLAPVVSDRDSSWSDVVRWVTYAMIQAEELGIDSENINLYKNSKDREIRRFLGLEEDLGSQMGLSNDFAVRIVRHVGNYREIYERNISNPFGLKRGENALWRDGGLMYSPPFR